MARRNGPGRQALASKSAGGVRCKLSPPQLDELEKVLDAGPAAFGWDADQRWTLARIAEVVQDRFDVCYSLSGLHLLLQRIGWSIQISSGPFRAGLTKGSGRRLRVPPVNRWQEFWSRGGCPTNAAVRAP